MNYTRNSASQSPDIVTKYLSNQPAPLFEEQKLDSQSRMIVQQRTNENKNLMRRTNQEVIDIRRQLSDEKAQLEHGHFRNWLKAQFNRGACSVIITAV
jgi:hypothetical protein